MRSPSIPTAGSTYSIKISIPFIPKVVTIEYINSLSDSGSIIIIRRVNPNSDTNPEYKFNMVEVIDNTLDMLIYNSSIDFESNTFEIIVSGHLAANNDYTYHAYS